MDEAKRFVQVSSWERLVPAHWWVQLGLVPLGGRAMSRGVFSQQLCPQEDSKHWPADRWGCVTALLAVWPEASQHWSPQAFG